MNGEYLGYGRGGGGGVDWTNSRNLKKIIMNNHVPTTWGIFLST